MEKTKIFQCSKCDAGWFDIRVSYMVRAKFSLLPHNDCPGELLVGSEFEADDPDPREKRVELRCERCGERWPVPSNMVVWTMYDGKRQRRLWPVDP